MSVSVEALLQAAAANTAAGEFQAAGDQLRSVLLQHPDHAEAATRLADIEIDHGLYGNAVARLLSTLRAHPRHVPAVTALARACLLAGRPEEALIHARRAVALDRADPAPRMQLARVLLRLGQLAEARAIGAALLAAAGDSTERAGLAHGLLSEVLEADADPAALEHFRLGATLLPGDPYHHMAYGLALLRAGDYPAGWEEYEHRRLTVALRKQALALPWELNWNGQDLRGRTIVLYDEQGIGDAIQFFRYLPMVAARGPARLIHVAFEALAPVFRTAAPYVEVLDKLPFGTQLQYHCPTVSLGRVFGTRVDSVPAPVPYLFADAEHMQVWGPEIGGAPRPRIGLAWSGNPTHQNDHMRSIPAALMLELTRAMPSGAFYALQTEIRPTDAAAVSACPALHTIGGRFRNFADTAAVIHELDLVITVDTAVAHLAGAMGKPVWVLLPRVADWRWLEHRDTSPWYPTARLFRADRDGWPPVIQRVAAALQSFAG
ncbi:MAG TPA: tetratricopeptide repeat protein [Acetobacteraceae bacterium]